MNYLKPFYYGLAYIPFKLVIRSLRCIRERRETKDYNCAHSRYNKLKDVFTHVNQCTKSPTVIHPLFREVY